MLVYLKYSEIGNEDGSVNNRGTEIDLFSYVEQNRSYLRERVIVEIDTIFDKRTLRQAWIKSIFFEKCNYNKILFIDYAVFLLAIFEIVEANNPCHVYLSNCEASRQLVNTYPNFFTKDNFPICRFEFNPKSRESGFEYSPNLFGRFFREIDLFTVLAKFVSRIILLKLFYGRLGGCCSSNILVSYFPTGSEDTGPEGDSVFGDVDTAFSDTTSFVFVPTWHRFIKNYLRNIFSADKQRRKFFLSNISVLEIFRFFFRAKSEFSESNAILRREEFEESEIWCSAIRESVITLSHKKVNFVSFIEYYLYRKSCSRFLSDCSPLMIKRIIFPFENQSWERAILSGVDRKRIKRIGYAHSAIRFWDLRYFNRSIFGLGSTDWLKLDALVTSADIGRRLIDNFVEGANVICLPSLRYAKATRRRSRSSFVSETVVGVFADQDAELSRKALDIYLELLHVPDLICVFVPHPRSALVFKCSDRNFSQYVVHCKSIQDWAVWLDLVITGPSTTAAIDLLEAGLKVCYFNFDRLDFSPAADISDCLCFRSREELLGWVKSSGKRVDKELIPVNEEYFLYGTSRDWSRLESL